MNDFTQFPIPNINVQDLPDLGAVTDTSSVVGEHAGTGRFGATALGAYAGQVIDTTGSVATIAALRAYTGARSNVVVRGYWAAGDGAGGVFDLATGAAADNGGTVIVDTSARRWVRRTGGGPLNARWFGAKGDGLIGTDDSVPIQKAVDTGLPVYIPAGTYNVLHGIRMQTVGQEVFGEGIGRTTISVPATFPLSELGVFSMVGVQSPVSPIGNPILSNPGPSVRDLDIDFDQVDTSNKALLIQFPPAVYISNTLRWSVRRVRMMAGWDGVHAYSNTTLGGTDSVGGGLVEDCQLGCLDANIWLDGATDAVRVIKCHFWPFGLTTNQQALYLDPAPNKTFGVWCGRVDDLHLTDCMFFCGLGLSLNNTTNGSAYGEMIGNNFNAYNGILMAAGLMAGSGNWFGLSSHNTRAIWLTGGQLSLAGTVIFDNNTSGNVPIIHLQGGSLSMSGLEMVANVGLAGTAAITVEPSGGVSAELNLTGFHITTGNLDVPAIIVSPTAGSAANVGLSCGKFEKVAHITYVNPVVLVQGTGVLRMANCGMSPKGSGTGSFVSVAQDNYHRVIGNSPNGYVYNFPTAVVAVYANN